MVSHRGVQILEHGHQNIKELAALFYEDGEIEAGDMDRNRPQQQDDEEHEPCTAALFLHHSAAGQSVTAGLKDTIVKAHAVASVSASSP